MQAFVSGAHAAVLVMGTLCLVAAVLSVIFVRRGTHSTDGPAMS